MPEKTPNPEANPDAEKDLEALAAEALDEPYAASADDDVVEAIAVTAAHSEIVNAQAIEPLERSFLDAPPRAYAIPAGPSDFNQRKLQTKGGAVAGVLLGLLSIAGAFLTGYSLINALLGLALSAWGMSSGSSRLATAGAVLSIIGLILALVFGLAR